MPEGDSRATFIDLKSAIDFELEIVVAESATCSAATDNTDIPLLGPEIDRGFFASIVLNLILDGLSLVQGAQPGSLNGRDVNEHIFAAAA